MGQEEAWASTRPSGGEVDTSEDSPGDLVLPLSFPCPREEPRKMKTQWLSQGLERDFQSLPHTKALLCPL